MESKAVRTRELGDYVAVIRRRWFTVLVCVVLCVGVGFAYLQVAPKTYVSSAKVLVAGLPSASSVAEDSRTTEAINLYTEAQIVKSIAVADEARATISTATISSDVEATQLARRVAVAVPPNTTVLDIEFAAASPWAAQEGARAFADAYLAVREKVAQEALDAQIRSVESELRNTDDRARILALNDELSALEATVINGGEVINVAQLPRKPRDPNPMLVLPSALFIGLLPGLGLALWRERLDGRSQANPQTEV